MTSVSQHDRSIIRELAKQVAELAARPTEAAKIAEWKRHNRFERGRALLVVRLEDVWDEFVPAASLACENEQLREAERILRQRLYMAEHIRDDTPVDGGWDVYLKVADPGYGFAEDCRQLAPDGHGRTGAKYCKVLPDGADPDEWIRDRELIIDRQGTQAEADLMRDVLGDIMPVSTRGKQGFWFTPVDTLAMLRGLEQFFVDMLDDPKWVHALLDRMTESDIHYARRAEQAGAVDLNSGQRGLAGGPENFTDELPGAGFDGQHPRLMDMWALGAAQTFSEVSPAMHEEFATPYEARYLDLFGLTHYGCCEPLHNKIHIVRKLPRMRRVSMSPWVDWAVGAENLGREFIYSAKPNPAFLQGVGWDVDIARREIVTILDAARANDCQLEFVLNGTLTCCGEPSRYDEWTDMVQQLTQEYA
ncbi:hypothetical protein LCGC14_0124530 [marine sediment metagenome]|uniref:Uroporphyrinogen decarboxylase (URO-D) domain-containing protein n=1 Tax=marine sediment metagenome TaxID=412755 RepID=A0A0F9Y7R5_9ZZZZ|nr:hypothetical protein [Phycisphaerae bacterium]HDZ42353.1 hypothetical protein [Phycisphaerae bacterium]